ncbi:MAG TPA: acyl-[ACP]--phospholipid O-acyltransferase [Terriglobales bacterium]|nr:acyl-[ACP]--phospholipid O-acyltransferase [Terriglobales bacterium]
MANPTSYGSARPRSLGQIWALTLTVFQSAFSEYALKTLVLVLLVGSAMRELGRERSAILVGALFAVPFLFFSTPGGFLADRFSKRNVTIGTKLAELIFTALVALAIVVNNVPLAILAALMIRSGAAVFGPSKYGILPELLPESRLSQANGILQVSMFSAIVTGSWTGAWIAQRFLERQLWGAGLLMAFAATGTVISLFIPKVKAADESRRFPWNPAKELRDRVLEIRADRGLLLAVLGCAYFYFLGTILQLNTIVYGTKLLGLSEGTSALLLAALAIGVGSGSALAGYVSNNKIEHGLVPLGTIGATCAVATMAAEMPDAWALGMRLGVLGFFAGIFIVPLSAMIQHRSDERRRGAIIAAANLYSFAAVFAGSALYYMLTIQFGIGPRGVFIVSGVLTLAATVYALILLPEALVRFLLWVLTHTVYRIKIVGRENVPDKGGALFVSNHMSFVDTLLLIASTDRIIRFVIFKDIYDHPIVKPIAKIMGAIPISAKSRPREVVQSLQKASDALKNGEVVCIFAEGQITRVGHLLPFRGGLSRIIKGSTAPIVPVYLDDTSGSLLSFERGRFWWRVPQQMLNPVTVTFGKPLPPRSSAFDVRQAVQDVSTTAYAQRKKLMRPLHWWFVKRARRHPLRFAMADMRVERVNFGTLLTRTIFLGRKLKNLWAGQEMVGVLLPPSVAGAAVNYAASMMGKAPINLNYTASNEVIELSAKQAGLKTVVTSRAFLEKLPHLKPPGEVIILEDLAANPKLKDKLIALALTWLVPVRVLEKTLGREKKADVDELITVIFSSGSTGEPKGVMLTHYNVGANCRQMGQLFMLNRHDKVLGILPFFHAFGYTVTIWLPVVLGVGAVYYPNPLDAKAIGELVEKYKLTFMVATPTFLQTYMRRCTSEQFKSLQYVIVGAEKLTDRQAIAFEEQFKIRPLEGYGCTECAPVVAVNTRDYRKRGIRQIGVKRGHIGHPLPGVAVRIVNPETMEPVVLGESGLLMVKGPNIMQGYLGRPDKTAEVLQDGWYNTGDIATLDEDGFLVIADRLSRFSKIGGEMVPHVKVEEELHKAAGLSEQTFAVTSVPDEKKGERLVVLHTLPEQKLTEVLEKLATTNLPPLWKPRPNQFFRVEHLPYLGTGKMDLQGLKRIAAEMTNSEAIV